MQRQMQEGILAVRRGGAAGATAASSRRMIFGVQRDHIDDLCLQRLERQPGAMTLPRLTPALAQRVAALVGKQDHALLLSGQAHQRATGQRGQSGRRALQT